MSRNQTLSEVVLGIQCHNFFYKTVQLSGFDFGHVGPYSVWEWDTSEVSEIETSSDFGS